MHSMVFDFWKSLIIQKSQPSAVEYQKRKVKDWILLVNAEKIPNGCNISEAEISWPYSTHYTTILIAYNSLL